MRRIRIEALLSYVKKWIKRVWNWLLDWVNRLRMLWKLFSEAILIHIGLDIRKVDIRFITIYLRFKIKDLKKLRIKKIEKRELR